MYNSSKDTFQRIKAKIGLGANLILAMFETSSFMKHPSSFAFATASLT